MQAAIGMLAKIQQLVMFQDLAAGACPAEAC